MGDYEGIGDSTYGEGDDRIYTGSSPDRKSGMSAKTKSGLRAAGAGMAAQGTSMIQGVRDEAMSDMNRQNPVPSYRKGGRVKKTGLAKVHRGEYVLTAKKARKYRNKNRSRIRG